MIENLFFKYSSLIGKKKEKLWELDSPFEEI